MNAPDMKLVADEGGYQIGIERRYSKLVAYVVAPDGSRHYVDGKNGLHCLFVKQSSARDSARKLVAQLRGMVVA